MQSLTLAVCGLHLRGQPLHPQLTSLGAHFLRACKSSSCYKFFAITDETSGKTKPGEGPSVPPERALRNNCDLVDGQTTRWGGLVAGMIKVLDGSGTGVYLELFDIPTESVGRFLEQIPPPLGLGTVELEGGSSTLGFICEGYIAQGGPGIEDITHLGSWHEYLKSKAAA